MSSVKRVVRVGAVCAAMVGAGVFSAQSASATVVGSGNCFLPYALNVQNQVEYDGVGNNVWEALQLSTGNVLYAEFINNYTGLNVKYQKENGSEITDTDFAAYDCATAKTTWDSGSFSESAGQTKSYAFNNLGSMSGDCGTVAMQVGSQNDDTWEISLCS